LSGFTGIPRDREGVRDGRPRLREDQTRHLGEKGKHEGGEGFRWGPGKKRPKKDSQQKGETFLGEKVGVLIVNSQRGRDISRGSQKVHGQSEPKETEKVGRSGMIQSLKKKMVTKGGGKELLGGIKTLMGSVEKDPPTWD